MSANVGMIDRLLRAIVGIGLIYWALTGGPIWAWIGVVPLLTAAVGFCPAYTLFGIRTCPVKQS
ncbi:YgaP family membrane protein [Rhodopseudomonas sp.]|uniref:YgaP family membrane protein n=1 Tax=Rhodopseudomonas sp. TaxID=1078 RepID=UPI003B3B3E29